MLLEHQLVIGEPAPGGDVGARPWIARDEPEHLAGRQCPHAAAQAEHQLTTAEVARIPLGVSPLHAGVTPESR